MTTATVVAINYLAAERGFWLDRVRAAFSRKSKTGREGPFSRCNRRRKIISLPRGFCPLNCYPDRAEQLMHGERSVFACRDRRSKKEKLPRCASDTCAGNWMNMLRFFQKNGPFKCLY